ncbi:MAG: hypothetical protein MJK04_21935 [Psychrosphaera sp.]|nr:hypothetical protein [Psychrosphaera sp.]
MTPLLLFKPDQWDFTYLNVGDIVLGGIPGQSKYYTTMKTLDTAGNSRAKLFGSLQVTPHVNFGYRDKMGVYQVTKKIKRGQITCFTILITSKHY